MSFDWPLPAFLPDVAPKNIIAAARKTAAKKMVKHSS